jgi:hypothetical protein
MAETAAACAHTAQHKTQKQGGTHMTDNKNPATPLPEAPLQEGELSDDALEHATGGMASKNYRKKPIGVVRDVSEKSELC